jgi:hypothetical protein
MGPQGGADGAAGVVGGNGPPKEPRRTQNTQPTKAAPRIPRRVAIATAVVGLTAAGAATALAAGTDTYPERAPFTKRCGVEIRAYDDGSASLYCDERQRPFAAVDADSGRIRFFAAR